MNSRNKGAVGEREWARWLREHLGLDARRGTNLTGQADVVDGTDIHWEVKRRERLNVYGAMAQAVADAGDKVPAVAHRRNRGEWLVTVRALDFKRLITPTGGDAHE